MVMVLRRLDPCMRRMRGAYDLRQQAVAGCGLELPWRRAPPEAEAARLGHRGSGAVMKLS
eukprot:1265519-Prymnesium_polylepis.2